MFRRPGEEEASAFANAEARQPFDLSERPLLRCVLISLGAEDHLLVLNVHHIVSDGWSMVYPVAGSHRSLRIRNGDAGAVVAAAARLVFCPRRLAEGPRR